MIHNEIFDTYRLQERVKEQLKAIKLLVSQGYTVLDLEGNIINRETYKQIKKPKYDYKRKPYVKDENKNT